MKTFEGIVVSDKMPKTVVVEVSRKIVHPLYKKLLTRSKKYKVETGSVVVNVGDRVRIVETRKLSKEKYFAIAEALTKKNSEEKKK